MIFTQVQELITASEQHVQWVYAALCLLVLWNSWTSVVIISLKEKAGKWEHVSDQLTLIDKKLDLFLKQETDSLKDIAKALIDRLDG